MVQATDDIFTNMALAWEAQITHDRANRELARLVMDVDPSLRLVWDNKDKSFWVGKVRTVAGADLLVPIFSVGDNPLPTDVVNEINSRRLTGRSREVARNRYRQLQLEQKRNDQALADKFLPNYGEYSWRVMQADDNWTRHSLMQDMRAEIRRSR